MRIIGADPSLTGFGIATPEGPTTLRPPKGMNGPARMIWILDKVSHAVDYAHQGINPDIPAPADLVVIEGFSYNSKGSSIYEIAGLGWILRVALHEASIPYVEVSPSQLKQYATGRGIASKEDVLACAIRRLGYEGSDHNQADALWLRELGLAAYGQPCQEMPQQHRKVLDKITWPDLRVPA